MKKLIVMLFAGAMALGGLAFTQASADEVGSGCLSEQTGDLGAGDACGGFNDDGTGHGKIDGNDANQAPAGGYIAYSNDGAYENSGLCVSDQGDPEAEEDEDGNDTNPDDNGACDDAIPGAVVEYITGGGE